jgi:hypothetical protein
VSRPPEKAMPTRSPTGREASTLVMDEIICTPLHDHATRSPDRIERPARHAALPSQPHRWHSPIHLGKARIFISDKSLYERNATNYRKTQRRHFTLFYDFAYLIPSEAAT